MEDKNNIPDSVMNDLISEIEKKNETKIIKHALEEVLKKIKDKKLKKLRSKADLEMDLDEFRDKDMTGSMISGKGELYGPMRFVKHR